MLQLWTFLSIVAIIAMWVPAFSFPICCRQDQARDAAKTVKKFGNVEESLRGGIQFYTDLQVSRCFRPELPSQH